MHATPAIAERNQRILIIDDNPSIHDDVRKILGATAPEDTAHDDEAGIVRYRG